MTQLRIRHGNLRWWNIANERRQRLIVKKHKGSGLTPEQEDELTMLQTVAEAVMTFGDHSYCRKCRGKLALRNLGHFPTHVCKTKD